MDIALMLAGGLAALIGGAQLLVRGAGKLALGFGISPLVVGLTVVAFGTSSPEMAVSTKSAWAGQVDIALGNVVGSNIFNVLFILGACAAISPLFLGKTLAWIDIPIMVGSALLVPLCARDGSLQWVEGALLIGGLAAYTFFVVRRDQKSAESEAAKADAKGTKLSALLYIAGGLGLLILGSRWFVDGAVRVAQSFGVSELVIALTIVAAGTSLPEVITSILATVRGEREIAVGNVVGSNIFNVLGVLGVSSVASGAVGVSEQARTFDVPIMIAVSLLLFAAVARGFRIARWHGLLFLAGYACYTGWLVLDASKSTALPQFERWLLWVGLPGAVLVMALVMLRKTPAPPRPS